MLAANTMLPHSRIPNAPKSAGFSRRLLPLAVVGLLAMGLTIVAVLRPSRPRDELSGGVDTAPASVVDLNRAELNENLPQLVAPGVEQAPGEKAATVAVRTPAANPATAAQATPAVTRPEPSQLTQKLVRSLFPLEQAGTPLTGDHVEEWKRNFQQLLAQGADAVPAIREILAQNLEFTFGPEASRGLGYPSARAAMFDALLHIGGTEAVDTMLEVLRTTAHPREIAMLARNLEQLEPEQHRGEALAAARELLAMPAAPERLDMGPVFELVQKFGGGETVADLEQASARWNYYAAFTLAQLPEGAGIPSLVKLVQADAGKGKSLPALEMLGGMAVDSPEARAALLEQAGADRIPPFAWAYLVPALAGERYQVLDTVFGNNASPADATNAKRFHIEAGNQNFYSGPTVTTLTPDWIQQQLGFIDQLLTTTRNPAAVQALQQSKTRLNARLTPANGVSPPAP